MAISNITPASTNVIEAGDTFAFDVDDTYTSMVIEVETASGWEYAYDSALGGQQTGYTVVVADDGAGTHTFTVGRDSGFDLADTNVKVTEDETGSSAETSFSYSLASQQLFPQGKSPYFSTFAGTLRVTDAGAAVRSDVGWIDLVGFDSVVDNGNGKVTVTVSGGGGSGDVVGPASVVDDRIAAFDGTTGKLIKDGAKLAADVVTGPASVATADVAIFSGTSGKIITDGTDVTISSGSLSLYGTTADIRIRERTTGPTIVAGFGGLWVRDDIPSVLVFRDDTGADTVLGGGNVVGPGASSNQGIARWSGATGKLLQNSTNAKIDGNSKFTLSGATAELSMLERATPPAGTAGYGDFWVKDDAPTTPMFTDDTGADHQLMLEDPTSLNNSTYQIPYATGNDGRYGHSTSFEWNAFSKELNSDGGIDIRNAGMGVTMEEGSSAGRTPTGGEGFLWVKNSDPSTLNYQDGDSNEVIVSPAHSALTLGAAATTFAIVHPVMTITGDGGANTLATITGAGPGQILTLIFVDALVTVTDDNTHAADSIDLSAAFTSADDTVLQLVYDGTSWYEISRSVN